MRRGWRFGAMEDCDEASGLDLSFERLPAPLPIWHAQVTRDEWLVAARAVADAGGRLVSTWGTDRRDRGAGFAACAAYALQDGLAWLVLPLPDAAPACPDLAAIFPAAGRMQRATMDLLGIAAEAQPTPAPGSITGSGAAGPPAARRRARTPRTGPRRRCAVQLPVRSRRRRRRARDRRRTGARRHHRAGALPLLGRRREGAAARAAPGLHAQGHRAALHRARRRSTRTAWRAASRATRRWPVPGPTAWRSKAAGGCRSRRGRRGCAR